jgi:hypothetical protein
MPPPIMQRQQRDTCGPDSISITRAALNVHKTRFSRQDPASTDTHVNWAATNSIHAQKSIEIPSIHVDFHTARLQPRLSKPGSVNVKGLRDTAFSKEKAAADLHVDRFSPKPACTEYLLSLRSRPDSLQACM